MCCLKVSHETICHEYSIIFSGKVESIDRIFWDLSSIDQGLTGYNSVR